MKGMTVRRVKFGKPVEFSWKTLGEFVLRTRDLLFGVQSQSVNYLAASMMGPVLIHRSNRRVER